MSSSLVSSSGEWLTPPLRLRTKSIPVSTPAAASTPASCPAPEGSSTAGAATRSISSRRTERIDVVELNRRQVEAGVEVERVQEARESLLVGRARIDCQPNASGNHVHGARLDLEHADRGDRAVDRPRRVAHAEHVLRRLHERVVARIHRRRAGVPGRALEHHFAPGRADDARHDAERGPRAFEHRPLLDVQLDVASGQRPCLREREASVATTLLVAKRDDTERARARADGSDCFDRGDDAERSVVLASVRHAVEVRAGPDLGQLALRPTKPTDHVPERVTGHREPRLDHPLLGERAGLALGLAPGRAIRSTAPSEHVELLKSLDQRPHD